MRNFSYFVAKQTNHKQKAGFSSAIGTIAIASVALGLAATIITFSIFFGFRNEIQEKILGLAGHIRITKFDLNNSYEEAPIRLDANIYRQAYELPFIQHIQPTANKAGLLKTANDMLGVLLKGVSPAYDSTRFLRHLKYGRFLNFSNTSTSLEIILSQHIANKLRVQINDDLFMYFVQNPPRARKLKVVGIYETGIEEFDELVIYGDLKLIQQLNAWGDSLVGSFEIYIKNFDKLEQNFDTIYEVMDYDLNIKKVTQHFQHYFDWFIMLNRNVYILLTIILFVALFNMVSITLILIMERTNMIGMLKALGASNWQVQQVFIYKGIFLVAKGLLLGNFIGIGLGLLQHYFHLIPLDYHTYYMHHVPIQFDWSMVLLLNLLITALLSLILLVPSTIISQISPIKSIRFS